MKRLVYSPKIEAFINADTGIYDLTEYITEFSIDRKINQVSTATINLRNPNKKWTNNSYVDAITKEQKVGPVFHPMDPITIILTRIQNHPVQVFTGFCDTTPYLQLFPGPVEITASCTLKKLLYTYFDAGLPFFWEFLSQYGWSPSSSGIVNPSAEQTATAKKKGEKEPGPTYTDSGIGELMYHVLNQIGGWPDSSIYIEEMPASVITLVSNLFEEFKQEGEEGTKELEAFLHNIVGTTSSGSGGGESNTTENAGGSGPPSGSSVTPVEVGRAMITVGFKPERHLLAQGMVTMSHESAFGTAPGWNKEHTGGVLGYWQIQRSTHPQYSAACCMNLICSTKGAYEISEHGTNWAPWAESDFGSSAIPEEALSPWYGHAEEAIRKGPFTNETTPQQAAKTGTGVHANIPGGHNPGQNP